MQKYINVDIVIINLILNQLVVIINKIYNVNIVNNK
jgi:hypothetical protein